MRAAVVGAERVSVDEQRLPDLRRLVGEREAGRHHADDVDLAPVERDRLSHDRGIAREAPRPQRVAENRDVVAPGLLLFREERAADRRAHAERGEHTGCRDRDVDMQTDQKSLEVFAGRRRNLLDAGTMQVAPDDHEAIGVRKGQRPQHDRVDDGEDGGVRADAERQRREDDDREADRPAQRAERETDVAADAVEPRGPRRPAANLLAHDAARLLVAHAGGDELVIAILEMLLDFLGETAPGYLAPISRNIFIEWLVLQVALVEKSSATLPSERRRLPNLFLSERCYERVAACLVLGGEQELEVTFAMDEFVFF